MKTRKKINAGFYTLFILLALAAGAMMGATHFDPPIPAYIWEFFLVVVSLLAGIFIYLMDFKIDAMDEIETHDKEMRIKYDKATLTIENLRTSLLLPNQIQIMGSNTRLLTDHFDLLCNLAEKSTGVKNTLIFFSTGGDAQDLNHYLQSVEKRFMIIKKSVDRGSSWKEIYSERGSFFALPSDKLHKLNTEVKNLLQLRRDCYEPYVMRSIYPAVNLIVFRTYPTWLNLRDRFYVGDQYGTRDEGRRLAYL